MNSYYEIIDVDVNNLPLDKYTINNNCLYHNVDGQIRAVSCNNFLYVYEGSTAMMRNKGGINSPVQEPGVYFKINDSSWNLFVKSGCGIEFDKLLCVCSEDIFINGQLPPQGYLTGNINVSTSDYYDNLQNVTFINGIAYPLATNENLIRNVAGVTTTSFGMVSNNFIEYGLIDGIGQDIPVKPNTSYMFSIECCFESITSDSNVTVVPREYSEPTYKLYFQTDANGDIITQSLSNNLCVYMTFESTSLPYFATQFGHIPAIILFVDQPVRNSVRLGSINILRNQNLTPIQIVPADKQYVAGSFTINYISRPN
jgi:hypothetical protein